MNSCPIPATRSPEPPFPCWGARELAQLEPAPSPQPPISRRSLLPRMLQPGNLLRRLRVLPQSLPTANDLRRDLHGCDDGAASVVSVHLPQTPWMTPQLLPTPVPVRAPAHAPLSPGGATQPPEPLLDLRAARPAHYRRT